MNYEWVVSKPIPGLQQWLEAHGIIRADGYKSVQMGFTPTILFQVPLGVDGSGNPIFPGTGGESIAPSSGQILGTNPANPGAGNELLITVPAGKRWFVRSLSYTYTASGVAGNRFGKFFMRDNAGNLDVLIGRDTTAIIANGSATVHWVPGIPTQLVDLLGTPNHTPPMPGLIEAVQGNVLRLTADAKDAGDTITGISLLVEEFLGAFPSSTAHFGVGS